MGRNGLKLSRNAVTMSGRGNEWAENKWEWAKTSGNRWQWAVNEWEVMRVSGIGWERVRGSTV